MRTTALALFALLSLAGCGDKDSDTASSGNCSSEYSCVNDVCECADGSSCADADACESACEVCE